MISTLLFLFVISLMITLAGFLLTARNRQPRNQGRTPSFARSGTTTALRQGAIPARTTRQRRPIAAYEEPRQRRPIAAYEESHRSISSWANILTLLDVRSIFTAAGVRKQTPWLGILFLLVMFFAVGLYSIHSLLPGSSFGISPAWMNSSASAQSAVPTVAPLVAPVNSEYNRLVASVSGASKALQRVGQLDPAQYASTQEFNTWAYSACSAASMTEVINSYGHNYRVTDILNVEARIGEITPALGLLEPTGIDHTVRQFGFKTVNIPDKSLDNLISIANGGRPIIVSFPPARWDGGHILVLRGGDGDNVYLADSSRLNMTVMTRTKFMSYWAGYAIMAVPQNA